MTPRKLISADSHIVETPDWWAGRVDRALSRPGAADRRDRRRLGPQHRQFPGPEALPGPRLHLLSIAMISSVRGNVASDYPHGDSTWPVSQRVVAEDFAGMDEADIHAITWANAAQAYGMAL
jgi:hypothetical protein